jgi:hypothetical protein
VVWSRLFLQMVEEFAVKGDENLILIYSLQIEGESMSMYGMKKIKLSSLRAGVLALLFL